MTLIDKSLLGHFLCRYLQNLSPSAKVSDETSYFVQAWIDVVRETNLNSWECDKLIASEASGPQKNRKMGLRGNFKLCGYGPHIHILSRPGRYLGGNLARTRKFLASERKFFGQQLTVAVSKSSLTTLGIKSKLFLKMKISINFLCWVYLKKHCVVYQI